MSGDVFAFEDDALVAQPYAADVSSVSSAFSAAAFDAVIVEGFGESTGDLALQRALSPPEFESSESFSRAPDVVAVSLNASLSPKAENAAASLRDAVRTITVVATPTAASPAQALQ